MTPPGGRLPTVCFVTYELAPINAGGVGTYITRMIPELAGRLRVIVLAGMSPEDVEAYRRLGLHDPDGAGINRVVSVDDVMRTMPNHPNVFVRNTQRFAHALAALCQEEPIDLIEMPEYAGMAYGALKLKRQHGAFAGKRMLVRLHGSLELIDYHGETTSFTLERRMIYGMERYAMRHADVLIAPTGDTFADYERFYALDRRPVICRPPVAGRAPVPGAGSGTTVLCVGRVQAIKGIDLFVRAGLRWMADGAPRDVQFRIVGLDVVPEHERFRRYVEALIPPELKDRFEFLGHRTAEEIAVLVRDARVGVVPSRWESFGYVARELLELGLPVVASRIAGFRELEDVPGMTFFDGSVEDLTRVMRQRWQTAALPGPSRVLPPSGAPAGEVYSTLLAGRGASAVEARASVRAFVRRLALEEPEATANRTSPRASGHQTARVLPPDRRLIGWLCDQRDEYLAVTVRDWAPDDASVQSAIALLSSRAEVAAVELPPRYVPAGLFCDREVGLLGLSEYDGPSDGVLGIAPAALVFRRPRVLPEILPGSPQDVMRQLLSYLRRHGEVEIAWPQGEVPRWPVLPADASADAGSPPDGGDPRHRWLLGYLGRSATRRPATRWATVVGPVYLVRRSWQLVREGGVRAYLQKIREVARRS